MRLLHLLIYAALCFTLIGASKAYALNIDQVRLGTHPEKTRLVLDLSEASDFRAFVLSNPYRLVIDLPSFEWRAGQIDRPANSGVTGVRYGNLQPGISRIVFDIKDPALVQGAFFLPRQGNKPDRLVVDFSRVSPSIFDSRKEEVHGSLFVNAQTVHTPAPAYSQTASYVPPLPEAKPFTNTKKPLVVIDPGHGGVDPGATGANNVFEKHVVLALAKELARQLESSGNYRVLLTRDSDVFIKLSDRVKFARHNNADLFVSIHADSIGSSHIHGASIYTLSEKASDEQTAKLAAQENRADLIAGIDLSVEDEDVANILVDLAMRDTMNQSKFFAERLVNTFSQENMSVLESPHRHAGFAVLKAPDIPSVLVEAGFMSNPTEARLLNSEPHRRKIAAALRNGIDAYFEQVRKNQRI